MRDLAEALENQRAFGEPLLGHFNGLGHLGLWPPGGWLI